MQDGEFINGGKDLPKEFYSSSTFTDYLLRFMQARPED
jgi:arylsulfatase